MSANIMLLPENVRHSLIAFRKELNDLGIRSQITSTVRSSAKQQRLYSLFKQGLTNYPVAPPGRSLHEYGKAVDMVITPTSQLPLAATVGRQYGFKWAGERDKVHFSYILPVKGMFNVLKKVFRGTKATGAGQVALKEATWQVGKGNRRKITTIPPRCR